MQQAEKDLLKRPQVIVLDVYDTLLEMSEVERRVNSLLSSKRGYTVWFELFMQYCFVDNCTVQFNDFASIAKATMQMAANKMDTTIAEFDIDYVLDLLKHLPVHDGVQEGLSALNDEGYRITALTNSPEGIVRERMERTGLISYFECVLSAEQVQKYKPSLEVYNWTAKKLGEKKSEILLASVHGWDIAGAADAGMQTAYIKQGKDMLYPLAPKPNLTCNNLRDLANQLKEVR